MTVLLFACRASIASDVDPKAARHPGSYVGIGTGYAQSRAWVQSNEDHPDFEVGPLHSWQAVFRVGDAFSEWFSIGFQNVLMQASKGKKESIAVFALFLDSTFYPWRGLGISPAVGLGFSYATGRNEFEFDYGGPLSLSLTLKYEFQITRLLVIAPVAQTYWVRSDKFDGLYIFFGLEFAKWFESATG